MNRFADSNAHTSTMQPTSRRVRYSTVFAARLLSALICALGLATASGQTVSPATSQLPINEPLEKYDMPPAYIYRQETSPRMVSPYGGFISYQVNVDANENNIVGDAANEPSITVDPINPNRMTIGWRQFNSISSNFRQGGWGYTTDGGVTWTFPSVLEPGVFRSDPVLNSDETGTFFYLSLLETFCDNIYRSTNGGQSWLELQPDGNAGGGDKEWFTIDKTNGPGHGFQYQAWSPAATCTSGLFSRSTDGGVTWQAPLSLPNSARWGTLDVATNGNLFIGGGNGGSSFWCIRSSNAQIGNQTPTFDQVTTVNMGGSMVSGSINPAGLTGQIFLWVDRSGGSTNNNIYMLCSVRPPSYSTGTDVMIARSTNGGASFSAPVRINGDATTNKWHWFGTFSVAPNGRLDAVWYDTRNDPGNLLSQLFYSYSTDGGVTWSANVAVSQSFDPTQGWPNQNKIGDYITIVSDNTGGNVAYAATFNFNPNNNQHEQDVYYVRVSPSGASTPTPTPTASPTATATATATATPTATPCTLAAPNAQTATNITFSGFTAHWSSISGATGYQLDVATDSSFINYVAGYQNLDVGNVTIYNVAGLNANTTYYYRVRAYNGCATSSNSSVKNVKTLPCTPKAPNVQSATNITFNSFTAHWSSVAGAIDYRLDVATDSSFINYVTGYQDLDAGNVTSSPVTGLSPNTTYYYRVRAYNGCATSANSSAKSVKTSLCTPAAPNAQSATLVTSSSFMAHWGSVAGVIDYRLDVATDSSFINYVSGYQNLSVGNVTAYNVTGLSANTTYYYRLRAYNGCATSANSSARSVQTSP